MSQTRDVTQLLLDIQAGDNQALEKLIPLVYDELLRLAKSFLRRERSDHTLQPTALVHEAYLRMADQTRLSWQSRAHFFGIAARLMRQILVDHSRMHQAAKRGAGQAKLPLDEGLVYSDERAPDLVALDDALKGLAEVDPRKAQVIELRYFGGLTAEEIAEVMGISTATITRDLRMAQAWLYREMGGQKAAE